jgi:putative aldouronate transport system permease protein
MIRLAFKKNKNVGKSIKKVPFSVYIRGNYSLYLMYLPAFIYFIIFCYLPIFGIVMAFQQFKPTLGFLHSPFVGLKHFIRFFQDPYMIRVFTNTILLGFYSLIWGFPLPILLALLFNELKNAKFKRVTQTISYMPHFLSLVIVVGIMKEMLGVNDGVINTLIEFLGFSKINFFVEASWFRTIYVVSDLWQGVGWSSIIYLAAIAGINPELYESAVLDGAGRVQQARYITIPSIMPTVVILFIFAIPGLLGSDMQKILLIYTESTYSTADVIGTYVYRQGIEGSSQSYSSAVGLLLSVISLGVLTATNYWAKHVSDTSLW